MSRKHTSTTPAGIPRSRSRWTRAERQQIRRHHDEVCEQAAAYAEMYGDDDDRDYGEFHADLCEICSTELVGRDHYAECSVCGCEGCTACLLRGDDVFPYMCPECEGKP